MTMAPVFTIISPIDGTPLCERSYMDRDTLESVAQAARAAFVGWSKRPLQERAGFARKMMSFLEKNADAIAQDVSRSIGRPRHMANEIPRLRAVVEQLILDAEEAFHPVTYPSDDGLTRYTQRQPKGVVLSICAWNYPVAMPANLIFAPLLAGDPVIFKHAPQTALIGDWFEKAAKASGMPHGVLQVVTAEHPDIERLIGEGKVDAIEFIGSTRGGFALRQAAAAQPIELGLEMGGNDACYVRQDADLDFAATEIISGAFGNSGQSCCSVERVYVHHAIYDAFLALLVEKAGKLQMGHPEDAASDLGPVISAAAAARIRSATQEAIAAGAKPLLKVQPAPNVGDQTAYVSPQILGDVTHAMAIIKEEIFGPVLCVSKVSADAEAIRMMNDSPYGLTAAIWTKDAQLAQELGKELRCGTFYTNRCDYADLYLPWGGVGLSGMGRINGGAIGFEKLTDLKSFVVDAPVS